MTVCQVCGVPPDAGFFDRSTIVTPPLRPGEEAQLARFDLHRNYCGQLLYFAQYTDPALTLTPGYVWEIRINGQRRDPYGAFEHVINPWGMAGFPLNIRLDEGAVVEFLVRYADAPARTSLVHVGGRLVGRYWYNTVYGGQPNPI